MLKAEPTDLEVYTFPALPEPMVPVGGDAGADNALLSDALRSFKNEAGNAGGGLSPLERFAETYPSSRWTPAVLTNLGTLYYHRGYFTRAKGAWREAWNRSKNATEQPARELADRALSELAVMLARVGEREELDKLLLEVESRPVTIASQVRLDSARQGQWHMHNKPEGAFLCGPFALKAVARERSPKKEVSDDFLKDVASTPRGFSLAELRELSSTRGVSMQIARRDRGTTIIVPSVAHWKVGHFGALVREEAGRYFMEDPTFRDDVSMSASAIDDESSGYFLVPAGPLPKGWHAVTDEESRRVFGKGHSGTVDEDQTKATAQKSGSCPPCGCGMPVYSFHSMLCSLSVGDTPIPPTESAGGAIDYTVTYNQRENENLSGNRTFSNFSSQWVSTLITWLQENSPGGLGTTIELRLPNGGGEEYTRYDGATKQYHRQPDSRAILKRVEDEYGALVGYERSTPDGSRFLYAHHSSPRFFLSEITDPAGNRTIYSYDVDEGVTTPLPGRLRRIYTSDDRYAEFTYEDSANAYHVTAISDPWGRTASFRYNTAGRLESITDAVGLASSFEYDPRGFMKAMTTPYGTTRFATGSPGIDYGLIAWIQATDPMGGTERVEMNLSTRETGLPEWSQERFPWGPGVFANTTDNDDRNTFYWNWKAWEEARNLTGAAKYSKARRYHWLQPESGADESTGVLESETPPLESRIWYNYPGQRFGTSNVGTHTSPSRIARLLDDGSTQLVQREYNEAGRLTKAVDPVGRETVYEYFENGVDLQYKRQKLEDGSYATLEEHGDYNANGSPGWSKDSAGQLTKFTYTPQAQIETVTNARQEITTFVYGTDADSPDYRRAIRLERRASTSAPAVVLARTSRQVLTVDGSVVMRETTTDADGFAVVRDFDGLNRPVRVAYPDNTFEQMLYDRLDLSWSRDRLGRWTERHYNARRQMVAERNPEGHWTQYGWCDCGALETLIDGNGNTTTWTYDLQGRVTSKLDARQKGSTLVYENTTSRLKREIDALNQTKEYTYFPDDALQTVTYLNARQPTPGVTFSYDPSFARTRTMSDGTGDTLYHYHPIAMGQFGAGMLRSVDGPLDNDTIEFHYDELRRTKERRIGGVAQTVQYDTLGRVDAVTNPLGTFDYVYKGGGSRLERVDLPNGQKTNYTYHEADKDLRLATITHLDASAAQIAKHIYDYSAGGNIVAWSQQRESTTAGSSYSFDYDDNDQLGSAKRTDLADSTVTWAGYSYDGAGNRLGRQQASTVVKEQPNAINQLVSTDGGGRMKVRGTVDEPAAVKVNGAVARMLSSTEFEAQVEVNEGSNTFTVEARDAGGRTRTKRYTVDVPDIAPAAFVYDDNGNLTSDGIKSYEWDAANRLIAINLPGATNQRSEFNYDGLNRRATITEKTNGAVTNTQHFLFDGTQIAEQRDPSGATTRRYFGEGEARIGGVDAGMYYYTRDHLGSIRELTDATGSIRASYDYDPFGVTTKVSGDVESDFGYTGHHRHISGHYLAPFRAYDPTIGRWISRDPIQENGGLNLYGYVGNRPINALDPLGLKIFPTNYTGPLAAGDRRGFSTDQYIAILKILRIELEQQNAGSAYAVEDAALQATNELPFSQLLAPFNNDGCNPSNNMMHPTLGEIDLEWFTDMTLSSPLAYIIAKPVWAAVRDKTGTVLPFRDPGETNAFWLAAKRYGYSDIFTPAVLKAFKP